jgi:integrase
VIQRNPAKRIPLPKSTREEMRFLSAEQIRVLADAIDPRHRALILMAGFTGLRWGELAGLRAEHLDLLRGTVNVREALTEAGSEVVRVVPTKTGQRRTVPLPRFLSKVLTEHLASYPGPDGFVFSSTEGGPLRRNNFYRRHFKPALRQAGRESPVPRLEAFGCVDRNRHGGEREAGAADAGPRLGDGDPGYLQPRVPVLGGAAEGGLGSGVSGGGEGPRGQRGWLK